MKQTKEQIQRDLTPTPEAEFAMRHWHSEYAHSGLGSMGFWDSLTDRQKAYCTDSVRAIRAAVARSKP